MRVSIVVAHAKNRVIGRDGALPWRLSNDLRNFKRLTMGHAIVMGRRTVQSIGRLLPGRTTIVLTRDRRFQFPGALIADCWNRVLRLVATSGADQDELFVVGGAEIYQMALPLTDRIYLTEIQANVEGDTFFPKLTPDLWKEIHREDFPSDEKNEFPHSFVTLDRCEASIGSAE